MGDDSKPWIRKDSAALLLAICLLVWVYSASAILEGRSLSFRLEATEKALVFDVDSQLGAAAPQTVNVVSFFMTYTSICFLTAMISLVLFLLGEPRKSPRKFEAVRIESAPVTGPKTGRGKRLCLEQIDFHLRNIHKVWLQCRLRRGLKP